MSRKSGNGGKTHRKGPSSRSRSTKAYPEYIGRVQMSREGYIFVILDGEEDDVFVKASKTRQALNGDTVRVAVTREKVGDHRREGEVVEIVERSKRPFVGILHFVGSQAWLLMQSKSMPYDIVVSQEEALALGGQTGMKAAAVVDRWDRKDPAPHGHIVDVLGKPGENDTEMHAILAEFGLPYRFEPEVENAADRISETIGEEELKGRRDFRDTLTFTIDPADAKDFDDALSFKKLPNGNYEVGVHIADVSYYVKPGDIVDKEAQARGTSVYLVDRTVPMLPEKLCNKLCSLRPHEEKLTFSTVFELTPKAAIVNRWFGRTVINSDYRFDYDGAQKIIEAGAIDPENDTVPFDIQEAVLTLNDLAHLFREKRFKAGAISFDRPEMKVLVDENGKPVDVYEKISKEANWLIEEFMLLANRSVAELIATGGKLNGVASPKAKTFVYRVHAEPDAIKIGNLREFAGTFGYKMGSTGSGKDIASSLNTLLEEAKDKPEFSALQIVALRSMAKATYSADNIGHYGLAFPFYTHFTSPIRRYPDTMVHRLLAMYLDGADSQSKGYYDEQCKHASERECIAADAERASIKYKLVEYMTDKVGKEFDGHVSGVTEWGMYVEIEPTKIEGMVPLRTIKSDWYEFDEQHYRIVGRRTGRRFQLGDPVRIKVTSANVEQKLLDYELVEAGLPEPEGRGGEGGFRGGRFSEERHGSGRRSSEAHGEGRLHDGEAPAKKRGSAHGEESAAPAGKRGSAKGSSARGGGIRRSSAKDSSAPADSTRRASRSKASGESASKAAKATSKSTAKGRKKS
ncbi:MAG: ribonuclease R [Bacteroidales bacterium]|nr:ribonuclease R [Candidatus Cryptobacteroides onthequi]